MAVVIVGVVCVGSFVPVVVEPAGRRYIGVLWMEESFW